MCLRFKRVEYTRGFDSCLKQCTMIVASIKNMINYNKVYSWIVTGFQTMEVSQLLMIDVRRERSQRENFILYTGLRTFGNKTTSLSHTSHWTLCSI